MGIRISLASLVTRLDDRRAGQQEVNRSFTVPSKEKAISSWHRVRWPDRRAEPVQEMGIIGPVNPLVDLGNVLVRVGAVLPLVHVTDALQLAPDPKPKVIGWLAG